MKENPWFKFAEEDLKAAEAVFTEKIYNQVCFHCQQAAEKLLKGYLSLQKQDILKTHFLNELLDQCVSLDKIFAELSNSCTKLNIYYIPTRYPDALPGSLPEGLPNEKDAQEALTLAREIKKFVEDRI